MNTPWKIRSWLRGAFGVLCVLTLVACGAGGNNAGVVDEDDDDNNNVTNTAPVARAGEDITITAGEFAQFNASSSFDFEGDNLSYRWSNGAQGVIASFQYNTAGSYSVTLTVTDDEGLSDTDSLTVTVLPAPVVSKPERIEIQGESDLLIGQVTGLQASVIYSDGSVQNDVQWSSDDTNVATVSAFGVVTARQSGRAIITAIKQHDGEVFSASYTINVFTTVTPPVFDSVVISGPSSVGVGSSIQLLAGLHYPDGSIENTNDVVWSVNSPTIASINAQGVLVGESSGPVVVTATYTYVGTAYTDTHNVTVTSEPPPTVQSVSISGPTSMEVGSSVSLNALVSYSNGTTGSSVNWSIDNTDIASINSNGILTANNFGDITVTAEQDGVSDTHQIEVIDADTNLASIEIFPKTLRLNSLESIQQAVAVGTNSDGEKMPLTHLVEWSTSDENIAQVAGMGEVTIINGSGATAELIATFMGVSGTLTIEQQGRSLNGPHVFFQKPEDWQDANMYIWVNGGASEPRGGWPGGEMQAVEEVDGWFQAQILPEYISDDGLVHFKFTSTAAGAQQSPNNLEMDSSAGHLWFTDASTSTTVAPEWMGTIVSAVHVTAAGAEAIYSDSNPDENLAGQNINAGTTLNIDVGDLPIGRSFKNWGGSAALYVVDPTADVSRIVIADVGEMELEAEFNIESDDGHSAGRDQYAAQCESCHGDKGVGDSIFSAVTLAALQTSWADKGQTLTVNSLAQYIESEMPFGNDSVNCTGLNSGDCAYDIAAMIFADAWVNQNNILVGGDIYAETCSGCHGEEGKGSPGIFPSLHNCTSCTTVDTLSTRIELTMPPVNQSQSTGPHDCDEACADAVADFILATFTGEDGPYVCQSDDYRAREVRLLSQTEYRNTIKQLFNLSDAQLPNTDFLKRTLVNGFENNGAVGVVSANFFESALNTAAEIVDAASSGQYLGCDASNASCVLDSFGQKVFRRPMTSSERSRYETLFNDYGADTVIQAMLASSSFLYRTELGAANGNEITKLTDFEIASALSYAILATTPDDTLLAAAASNQLNTQAQILAQVQRLLNLPEAKTTVGKFVSSWLGSEAVLDISKEEGFLTESLREAMVQETEDFASHVIFDGTGHYSELITADYTVVNQELAQFYELDGSGGVTQYAPNTRTGVLGHASVLTTFSAYDQTSPIKRGLFVRRKLLCQTFPEPPDDIVVMAPKQDPNLTTRERFALHTENPVCQSCHQYIDELGFGFENFDTYGRFRTTENGELIDPSGDLNNVEDLTGDPTSNLFNNVIGLADIVSESQRGKACYALNYYRYTYGASENEVDECKLDPLTDRFIETDGDILDFMERLLSDESFITRKRTL